MNHQTLNNITKPIRGLIDIGAHVGSYAMEFYHRTGNRNIFMIEANPACEPYLKSVGFPYLITGVSQTEGEASFFCTSENKICTGNSLYRENSSHYSDEKLQIHTIPVKTLDSIIAQYPFIKNYNILKIDTQGSEMDIIRGGRECLHLFDYIILETSLVEYNINAPQQKTVINLMESIGFMPKATVEEHRYVNGDLFQEDILFEKK